MYTLTEGKYDLRAMKVACYASKGRFSHTQPGVRCVVPQKKQKCPPLQRQVLGQISTHPEEQLSSGEFM